MRTAVRGFWRCLEVGFFGRTELMARTVFGVHGSADGPEVPRADSAGRHVDAYPIHSYRTLTGFNDF